MQDIVDKLITESIGLDQAYYVSEIIIDDVNHQINIQISCSDDAIFECPECHEVGRVYDKLNKKWRHVDLINYKVYIQFLTPRVKCDCHGVKLVEVSWAKPRHKFTYTMEEFICELAQKMPLVHVGKVVDEHDTRIKRIIKGEQDEKNN